MLTSKLYIFIKTAQKLSFTKAAEDLYMTQPAVTKHIHKLEQSLEVKLFDRNGNKIVLTAAGELLLKYAVQIENLYNELFFDLSQLKHQKKGHVKIGASTTITQYVLPAIIYKFSKRYPELKIHVMNANTEKIEKAVLNNEIDIGIIEGHNKRSGIQYKSFLKDEIVLVGNTRISWPNNYLLDISDLKKYPMVIRESGSGTREVLVYHLRQAGLCLNDFNVVLEYGSTQGIKNYLLHSNAVAFLSLHSVQGELERGDLQYFKIKNFKIERLFNFIFPKGQQNKLSELVLNFSLHNI